MNYIIFDLEFNQEYNTKKRNKNIAYEACPFEIIQIGAVVLNENFETIKTMDSLVRPEIYLNLNPFIEKLTGITIEELNIAKPFKDAYSEFIEFFQGEKNILCVWGLADIKELYRNIKYHNLDTSPIPKEYINIQHYASKYFKTSKGINIGLSSAVELLNIPFKNEFHNAFADAYYTAEVFKKVYTNKIEPKIYNHTKPRNSNRYKKEKSKIDIDALMKQFEKMFNREMSQEEKSIIRLAYIMGKTNQFELKNSEENTEHK
jgi:DNA polymerase III epsilon subunit-like protein